MNGSPNARNMLICRDRGHACVYGDVRCAVWLFAFGFSFGSDPRRRGCTHTHARSKHEGFTSSCCTKGNLQTATISTAVTREALNKKVACSCRLLACNTGEMRIRRPYRAPSHIRNPQPPPQISTVHLIHQAVCPPFIRTHTHVRLIWDPKLASFLFQQA